MDDEIRKEYFAQTSLQYTFSQLTGENFSSSPPLTKNRRKKFLFFCVFCNRKVLIMSTKLFDVRNSDVTTFCEL
jgi:hypothetical protein